MAPGVSRSVTIRIPGNRSLTVSTSRSNGTEHHHHVRTFGVDLIQRGALLAWRPA